MNTFEKKFWKKKKKNVSSALFAIGLQQKNHFKFRRNISFEAIRNDSKPNRVL